MHFRTCNIENMRKFVDALRSGDYTQGQNALERTDLSGKVTNCCLGVACRVAIKDGLELQATNKDGDTTTYFAEETAFLPYSVQEWLGVATGNPVVNAIHPDSMFDDAVFELVTATYLNDSGNYTFNQIADAFERTFLTE